MKKTNLNKSSRQVTCHAIARHDPKCLLCKCVIDAVGQNSKGTAIVNSMTNGFTAFAGDAGYGSKVDGNHFLLFICDDCIAKNNEVYETYAS